MLPFPPIWMAAPPEVHSALLNFGFTPVGIELAGASWKDLALQYAAGAAELEGILSQVQASYQGPTAERFVAAHQPYLSWLGTAATKAALASAAHDEVAAAYTGAVAAMPTLAQLAENHVTHGVLVATNFFGVNTAPIAINEADYMRMWIQAADVMTGWDTASSLAADSIPPTSVAPMLVIPGVGEAGAAAASSAGVLTVGQGAVASAALSAADLTSTKLLAGKAVTSPASAIEHAPAPRTADQPHDTTQQQLQPETMASSMMQQMASVAPSAGQSAASALQGGPQQLLSTAPQLLSSAPQTLGQMLTSFGATQSATGLSPLGVAAGGSSGSATAMPVGFAGTGAISGINPAGLTSLAGGAFGSGPARPLLPSTWGASPTTAAQPESAVRAVPVGMVGASTGAAGGPMMGHGAAGRRSSSSTSHVSTYADNGVDDDDTVAERGYR